MLHCLQTTVHLRNFEFIFVQEFLFIKHNYSVFLKLVPVIYAPVIYVYLGFVLFKLEK